MCSKLLPASTICLILITLFFSSLDTSSATVTEDSWTEDSWLDKQIPTDNSTTHERLLESVVAGPSCSNSGAPSGSCYTVSNLVNGAMSNLEKMMTAGGLGDKFVYAKAVAQPLADKVIYAAKMSGVDQSNLNLCMGSWKGSGITGAEAGSSEEALDTDGCSKLPLASDQKWTILSVAIPPAVLANPLFCPTFPTDEPGTMCMAFSACGGSVADVLATSSFAFSVNGAMAGCLAGNPALVVATGGTAALVGSAVKLAMKQAAIGVSMTGSLRPAKGASVWAGTESGANYNVDLNANVWMTLAIETDGFIPKPVDKYVGLSGTANVYFMVGDGRLTGSIGVRANGKLLTPGMLVYTMYTQEDDDGKSWDEKSPESVGEEFPGWIICVEGIGEGCAHAASGVKAEVFYRDDWSHWALTDQAELDLLRVPPNDAGSGSTVADKIVQSLGTDEDPGSKIKSTMSLLGQVSVAGTFGVTFTLKFADMSKDGNKVAKLADLELKVASITGLITTQSMPSGFTNGIYGHNGMLHEGTRVKTQWIEDDGSGDGQWYQGKVTKVDAKTRKVSILYDDSDIWTGLADCVFTLDNDAALVKPGIYLYGEVGGPELVTATTEWIWKNIGALFDSLGGKDTAKRVYDSGAERAAKTQKTSSAGLYANTDGLGFTVTFPAAIFFAPGHIALLLAKVMGRMTVQCRWLIHPPAGVDKGISCGTNYNGPQWVSALWQGTKMVVGRIANSIKRAVDTAALALRQTWNTAVHLVNQAEQQVSQSLNFISDISELYRLPVYVGIAYPALYFPVFGSMNSARPTPIIGQVISWVFGFNEMSTNATTTQHPPEENINANNEWAEVEAEHKRIHAAEHIHIHEDNIRKVWVEINTLRARSVPPCESSSCLEPMI